MSGYLKKVFIIGNVGKPPETRFLQDGTPVASFSVAVNDRGKGEQQADTVTWFRVTAWRRQAEIVQQYLTTGTSVFVSGDLTMREFTGNDGQKRTTLEVNMQDMQILTPKGDGQQAPARAAGGGVDLDEDIPFHP